MFEASTSFHANMEHYEQLKDSLKLLQLPVFFRWEVVPIPWGFVWAPLHLT